MSKKLFSIKATNHKGFDKTAPTFATKQAAKAERDGINDSIKEQGINAPLVHVTYGPDHRLFKA